jgi:hypothetical protein
MPQLAVLSELIKIGCFLPRSALIRFRREFCSFLMFGSHGHLIMLKIDFEVETRKLVLDRVALPIEPPEL